MLGGEDFRSFLNPHELSLVLARLRDEATLHLGWVHLHTLPLMQHFHAVGAAHIRDLVEH